MHHGTRHLSVRSPFFWNTLCILHTTFSTAESNMHQECSLLRAVRNMLPFTVVNVEPNQDRPSTPNNPAGKSRMRLDPRRMDMENVVYRMQCVVDAGVAPEGRPGRGRSALVGRVVPPPSGEIFVRGIQL
ncbi:hypothetical protein AVEN_103886-1 [Araneus ventricosus]|uniref:Uncharacterized protein n=1 Tax=Araneus ventricosus TaxID=182803 RepID=A0A4Y2K460_ARAVE|nr:hypothetical protein AVEN_103886-1 [Araneus ventricosus]